MENFTADRAGSFQNAGLASNVPVELETLSALIGAVYDCVLDPARWPRALALICAELNFATAALNLQALPSGTVLLNVTSGIADEWVERLPLYGSEILDLWGGSEAAMSSPLDEPAILSVMNPAVRDLSTYTNRYYLEWAKPQGMIDTMAMVLARDGMSIGTLGLGRHESAGPIGHREFELARLLIPHLQRATAITRLLDLEALATSAFETVLDALTTPIFVVADDLRIVHANANGRLMLEDGGLFQSRRNCLTARPPGIQRAMALAVTQAGASEAALERRGFDIPVLNTGGAHRSLHVLPLGKGSRMNGSSPAAVAAIFVSPVTPTRAAREVVAGLFGLTAAEARVFDYITAGRTVAETAAVLGVGIGTVKTHLLRLFDKCGVRRQPELMQLAASFALPV